MAKAQHLLTTRGLASLRVGEWASDPAARGAGRLQVRCTGSGLTLYFRYTGPDGVRVRVPLGAFDSSGREGLTLVEARTKAGGLLRRYQAGAQDLRAALKGDKDANARQLREAAAAAEIEATRRAATVGALLTMYADMLDTKKKVSAREVRGVMNLHVKTAAPTVWTLSAMDLTPEHVIGLLSPMVKAKKLRTADKLRSCLRAAYALAIRSHTSPSASNELRALNIRSNPVADIATVEGARNARDRALTISELRAYWRHVGKLAPISRALLHLHLLSGCQRVPQLARVTVTAWDRDAQTITMLDPKGRRSEPRKHVVPLLPEAAEAVEVMRGADAGPYLFTVTGGLSGASYFVVEDRVRQVSAAMVLSGEASSPFTPGDLRRTVETRLAAAGVSSDVRAQLQSHGLGGIQSRHYDRHDYLIEKRAALETLHRLMTGQLATITPIKGVQVG